jgi:ADP-ribosyl-[dinitrogen reductase] hydrolase
MRDDSYCFDLYEDSLAFDLQVIRNWGAIALITLIEDHELKMCNVKDLSTKVNELNMLWIHLPIASMALPGSGFEEQWSWVGPGICRLLRDGFRVVIHCKEGIGRTGLVTARILIEMGMDPDSAIKTVKKTRPGTLQLYSQQRYCHNLTGEQENPQQHQAP